MQREFEVVEQLAHQIICWLTAAQGQREDRMLVFLRVCQHILDEDGRESNPIFMRDEGKEPTTAY